MAIGPGRAAHAVHAKPPGLAPGLSVNAALQRIGRACLLHLVRNENGALAGDAEAIHQMRVAVRRLRAALSAAAPLLPKKQRRWAADELRWFADTLGEVRNLDVFLGTLLPSAREDMPQASEFERLALAVGRRRQAAQEAAVAAILSPRYTSAVLDLLRWFDGCGWGAEAEAEALDQPIDEVAPLLLERCRRQVRRRAKHFARQTPAQRHRLRIALKKLRYAVEAFGELYDRAEIHLFVQRLKRLQDELGDANDLRIGRAIVAALVKPPLAKPLLTKPSLAKPALSGPRKGATGIALAGRRLIAWHKRHLAENEEGLRHHLREMIETEPFWRN
ncbi:MAG TPA: CHAD domain-containing protein [Stellaceae bacterium]|nr:CHAD domain-containing protein [Stellaceae bacterium]